MNSQNGNGSQEDANVTQILATVFPVFITFFTVKSAGVHWSTAACLAAIMGMYYLGLSWNHTTGITAKPKNTITALTAAAVFPAVLMLVGLPFMLGNILFWAIFPWAQRFIFKRDKDPKPPPPNKVDVDTA